MDLAGSERLDRSGAGNDAQRLRETQAINKSLSCLADVFSALSAKASHVPFRNSKLTYLMQVRLVCVCAVFVCGFVCPIFGRLTYASCVMSLGIYICTSYHIECRSELTFTERGRSLIGLFFYFSTAWAKTDRVDSSVALPLYESSSFNQG